MLYGSCHYRCMMSQELFADLRLAVFAPFFPWFLVFFPVFQFFGFWFSVKPKNWFWKKNWFFLVYQKTAPAYKAVGHYNV